MFLVLTIDTLVLGNQIPPSIKESNSSFRLRTDEVLLWAVGNKSALTSHTSRLQYTFQTLSLIMPEQILESHVFRAEILLLSPQYGSSNTEAFEILSFLLSNNFLSYSRQEEPALVSSLLYMLQNTHSWSTLAAQQFTKLPLSVQSTLNRLFKEAVQRSHFNSLRSLLRIGVDVNQTLPGLVGYRRAPSAFEYAVIVNNPYLAQILIEHGATAEMKDLEIMIVAWETRKIFHKTPEAFRTHFLSNHTFGQGQEERACFLLEKIASTTACPISEEIIGFFRKSLHTPTSISQLLITAIKAQSKFVFELLSENRNYINLSNSCGETPLKTAICGNDAKVLERLLELGACLDTPARIRSCLRMATSLQCAAFFADVNTLRRILRQGANLDFCHSSSPVYAFEHDTTMGPRYTSFGSMPEQRTAMGKTALQAALLGRNNENALFLLKNGAILVGGELSIAIISRQDTLIDQLLARGASFDDIPVNLDIVSVLEAAILTENTSLVSRIIDANPRALTALSLWAAIFVAKATSNLAICHFLVGEYAKKRVQDDVGLGTALSASATLGVLEIAEVILRLGLRPKSSLYTTFEHSPIHSPNRDFSPKMPHDYIFWRRQRLLAGRLDDSSPLMDVAVTIRRVDYIKMLLRFGYHPPLWCHELDSLKLGQLLHEHGTNMSWRAVKESIKLNNCELTEWLLSLDINLNGRKFEDADGKIPYSRTPVQIAAGRGNIALLERLVNLGADINAAPTTKYFGATALQAASIKGYFGLVRRILELGADPNAPGSEVGGRTALEGAAEHGRLDVVQLILNSGVETSGSGRRQYVRAIAFARKEGHHTVATLLECHREWTETDQGILDENDLLHYNQRPKAIAERQRIIHDSDEDSEEDSEEDSAEGDESSEISLESDDELSRGFSEAADDEVEMESSGTRELVREEVPSELLPSSIMDEVRESVESDCYGATENYGDGIWADAYETFSSDFPCSSWQE